MVVGPGQSGVLHHKFDIDDTACILLDIEGHTGLEGVGRSTGSRRLGTQVVTHLGAHVTHFAAQFFQVAGLAEHLGAHTFERRADLLAAHQHPRPYQRLVFPGPGLVLLVTLERAQRADQQPRGTGRAQTHVHVIQLARVGLGGQQVNDALAQAREELRAVDRLGAVGFGLRVAVMDKHQVQVRTVAKLQAADLAVTNDDEPGVAQAAVAALGLAVAGHGLAPGQGQHLVENGFGQPGQVVADFHQRQVAADFRSSYAQAMGQFEVAQRFHLLLEVVLGDTRQAFAQLTGQLWRQGRAEQAAFIEQLIKQQRVERDLLGNPWAGSAQGQQAAQGTWVFGQQHQVGRAPRHGLDQRQHPLQHQVGVVMLHRLGQQPWNKCVQALTANALHRAQLWAGAQPGQAPQGLDGLFEAGFLQLPASGFFILRLLPQRRPLATDHQLAFAVLIIRVGDDLAEVPVDTATPVHQLVVEALPVGKAKDIRHPRLVGLALGQHLRLAVGDGLDGVLGVTQEFIALAQLGDHCRRQITLAFQRGQHFEQRPLLQAEVAPAVDQLEGLGDEFHLSDATGTQLDVVGHTLAPHFLLDQLLHGAQRFDRGKIQVSAVHERAQYFLQLRAGGLVARHDPRLDHRVALPVAALVLVVLLQCVEAEHQRASRAIRAQAHVDAEHEAVDGHRVQCLDQPLAKAGKELLVIQRALHPFGFAAFGEAEDQVDVRRQVQLHRPKLAHAQHHHVLRLAAAVADGRAELLAMARIQPLVGFVDGRIGQVRQVAAGFAQLGLAGDVAPDDAQLLAVARAAQVTRQFVFALRRLGSLGNLPAQLTRGVTPLQLATGQQGKQHGRVALGHPQDIIAGGGNLIELLPMGWAPTVQVKIGVGSHGIADELPVANDQWLQGDGQIGGQR